VFVCVRGLVVGVVLVYNKTMEQKIPKEGNAKKPV